MKQLRKLWNALQGVVARMARQQIVVLVIVRVARCTREAPLRFARPRVSALEAARYGQLALF